MDRQHLPESFEELRGLRARALVRESTEEQGVNGSGPEEQRRAQAAFAVRYGLVGPDVTYTDFVSGSDASRRPQFQAMVRDAERGQFDVLLVLDSSRFGRNEAEVIEYQQRLHRAGVVVAYILQNALSSGNAGSRILLAVSRVQDAEYLRVLSTKVHGGYRRRYEGRRWSGSVPFGYRMEYVEQFNPKKGGAEMVETGQIVPDERPIERVGFPGQFYTRAALVRQIGEMYATGAHGLRGLADVLTAEGYRVPPSPNARKGGAHHEVAADEFTSSTLRVILSNRVYLGEMWWLRKAKTGRKARPVYGREEKPVEGHHEALWTPELFRDIRAVAGRKSTGGGGPAPTCRCADDPHGCRAHYAYRRQIVCVCGNTMYAERRPNGTVYYACPAQRETAKRSEKYNRSRVCSQLAIRESDLDAAVARDLAPLASVMAGDVRDAIAILNRQEAQPEPTVDEEAIRAEMRRVADAAIDGLITRDEALRRKRALDARLVASRPRSAYNPAAVADARDRAADFLALWDAATPAERQEIVAALFDGFRLQPDGSIGASVKPEYEAPIAIGLAKVVSMARPEGVGRAVLSVRARSKRAVPTLVLDNVQGLVEALRRAA